MSPLTRRVLLNGLMAAVVLAVVGVMLAELAGTWAQAQPGVRTAPEAAGLTANATGDVGAALKWRLPFSMAAWGFGMVAICECFAAAFRKPVAAKPKEPSPDEKAEAIIQQILAEHDAKTVKA